MRGEHRGEGRDKLVAIHRVDVVQVDLLAVHHGHVRRGLASDVEEQEVQDDGRQRADGHAGAEDDLQPGGHDTHDAGLQGHEEGQADRRGDDDGVAVVAQVDLRQGLDADDGNVGEHRQGGTADDRLRDCCDDGSRLGQQAQEDHEDARRGDDPAGLHAGEAHEANVLREAGVRERVEDTAQQGGQAVGAQGIGDVARGDALAHDLAGGEDVARGLHRGDRHDDDHGDERGERELGDAEVEGRGDAQPTGLSHAREIGLAHRKGNGCHDEQGEQHGQGAHEPLEEALDDDDDRDRSKSEAECLECCACLRCVIDGPIGPGDDVTGGDGQERRAHDGQERTRDDRWEETQELGEEGGGQEDEKADGDDGAVHGGQAGPRVGAGGCGRRTDRNEGGDGSEGDALDKRELHADEAADAGRLDDGGDAAGKQVCVDEVDQRVVVEPEA